MAIEIFVDVGCCYRFGTNLSILHKYCDRMGNEETIHSFLFIRIPNFFLSLNILKNFRF